MYHDDMSTRSIDRGSRGLNTDGRGLCAGIYFCIPSALSASGRLCLRSLLRSDKTDECMCGHPPTYLVGEYLRSPIKNSKFGQSHRLKYEIELSPYDSKAPILFCILYATLPQIWSF